MYRGDCSIVQVSAADTTVLVSFATRGSTGARPRYLVYFPKRDCITTSIGVPLNRAACCHSLMCVYLLAVLSKQRSPLYVHLRSALQP